MRCATSSMRALGILLIAAFALAQIAGQLLRVVEMPRTVAGLLTETDPPPGFETALEPRAFDFPSDHAAHPRYRSEWWYFTGNVNDETGASFGFQLTLFRFALRPTPSESRSPWRRSNIFLGHFAVSDVDVNAFHNFERQSRPALDLAGAKGGATDGHAPKIWLRDWVIELIDTEKEIWRLQARESDVSIALELTALRPIAAQGNGGLSKKSTEPGNASYYYSIPRLAVTGSIETPSNRHKVHGRAWFDHEWSTSALADGQLGWDWFSLQLGNGTDIMFYQIRNANGQTDAASHGVLLPKQRGRTVLNPEDIQVAVTRRWQSPSSGVRYPAAWEILVPSQNIALTVIPKLPHQEWNKNFTYWEGAVEVDGTAAGEVVNGEGYVELVGYE